MTTTVERWTGLPAEWDAFVRTQTGWTTFHLSAWKSIVENVHGHECPYMVARDSSGGIAGVLPLVRVKSILFGHFLVSMPFVNYGGPLGTADAVQALTAHAVELAQSGNAKLLELRSKVPLQIDLPSSHRKITVLLDLPDDTDVLRKSLGSKLRSQIKRPEKEGVVVRFGSDQVVPFFDVFSRHMRDLGTPTQPLRLFQEISRCFPEDAWFACAWLDDIPIAAGAGFRWGGEFEMTWASSLTSHNRIAPNMLLYWAFMERCISAGVRLFNFGRCSPDSGTHRFKRQWGSRDEQVWWYQHTAGDRPVSTPSPSDGSYSWGPRLWQRLPLSVATALGPRIVRSIP